MINTFLTTGIHSGRLCIFAKNRMMKNNFSKGFLSIMLAMAMAVPAGAQAKEKKEEAFRETISLVEAGSYRFTVRTVNPTGTRTIHPTSVYTLEAKDTVFTASLPYFGRAYQASYGGDGPVEFNGPAENLEITTNERKRQVSVSFRIQGKSDRYDIRLVVGYQGFGNLYVTPVKRQAISYYGIVEAME